MAIWLTCSNCKKHERYYRDELRDIGKLWHPKWEVPCHNCRDKIIIDQGKTTIFDNVFLQHRGEFQILTIHNNRPKLDERIKHGNIREYWLQQYFKEQYREYGFTNIEGPFDYGPDFKGIYKGKEVWIEVEIFCKSYLKHKHQLDKRFNKVEILVVLQNEYLSSDIKELLPKIIIKLNLSKFIKWCAPKIKKYAIKKQIENRLELIAEEFQKRLLYIYKETCDRKNTEMAFCPNCENCVYLDYDEYQSIIKNASNLSWRLFLEYNIDSNDFKLSDLDPELFDRYIS